MRRPNLAAYGAPVVALACGVGTPGEATRTRDSGSVRCKILPEVICRAHSPKSSGGNA